MKVTSSGICGSDLHLYEVMGPFLDVGDVLGHEVIGIVEETGAEVGLYGQVPGGQAEYLRVPQAQYGPIKVPEGPPDDRFVYMSDVLPTAWQAVEYAGIPPDGTVVVLGLGPIGDMACRVAMHRGHRVIGVDLVPERLERATAYGVEALLSSGDVAAGLLPDAIQRKVMQKAGVDQMAALLLAIDIVRRGGTFASHRLPLSDGPAAYKSFQQKTDDMVKVLLNP
ncbi:alcohol dehydrogenase catalytic domain-containing protein [Kribbella sp. NPDC050459]|uniref:alcohol dehydrogenase catalytic domain-containing protein n=1 Tax=Kribbella sp. NPDC050459 TaxID=3155785 RepID=UPI0033D5B422